MSRKTHHARRGGPRVGSPALPPSLPGAAGPFGGSGGARPAGSFLHFIMGLPTCVGGGAGKVAWLRGARGVPGADAWRGPAGGRLLAFAAMFAGRPGRLVGSCPAANPDRPIEITHER